MPHVRWIASCALVVAASASAAVDVEIRNGDKVAGTLSPAAEVEVVRFRVPKGAVISVKAVAAKKPLQLHVQLKNPTGDPMGAAVEGKSASIAKQTAPVSGLYSVEISSKDHVTGGDYAFAAAWKSPTSFGGKRTIATDAGTDTVEFSADAGATATLSVKKSKRSAAAPTLATLTYPDATVENLTGARQTKLLGRGGDCVLAVTSATAGDVTATVKVKPPKASNRKYALTAKAIGGGDATGDTAFSAIVGPEGGTIAFPPIASGQPGSQLDGAGVTFPAGALPFGTAIVIATAPDIATTGAQVGAGATVAFGPEGLVFGTKTAPAGAAVTIPFDVAFRTVEDQITILTRDARGVVTPVAKPYTFDLVAKTVSFAAGHFSSYRAVSAVPAPDPNNFRTIANIPSPYDICEAFDPSGATPPISLFVADAQHATVHALRLTDAATQQYSDETWVGGGTQTTFPGDRRQIRINDPVTTVYALPTGVLYFSTRYQVFVMDPTTDVVSLVAGLAGGGDSGDGGDPLLARFNAITGMVVDSGGGIYVADNLAHRIRFVKTSAPATVTAWAGNGTNGIAVDGEPIATTQFLGPADVAFAPGGGLYVADEGRIRHIDPAVPLNVTVAGDVGGAVGGTGDDGPPLSATFRIVQGITPFHDPQRPSDDALVVADNTDDAVRIVNFTTGVVRLIAGAHGTIGFNGDVGMSPGLLHSPFSVLSRPGAVFINDYNNQRVRIL